MSSSATFSNQNLTTLPAPTAFFLDEARLAYRFVRRDFLSTVTPSVLFTAAALRSTGAASLQWARGLGGSLLFFGLFLYTFCLGNQIAGVAEDAVNKPDRPIPSRLVTLRGAKVRWAMTGLAFPLVAFWIGGLGLMTWALALQIVFLAYDYGGLHRHWFTKNLVFITVGSIAMLGSAWQIAAPLNPTAWRWIIFLSIAFGVTLPLQDLRDVEGDRLSGRTTLSMSLGDTAARVVLATTIALLPVAVHVVLMAPLHGWTSLLCEGPLSALNLMTAARILVLRTKEADHATYTLHTLWFSALLGSSLWAL